MSPGDRSAPEPRQTLAMRLAERNRQRALRAERLARLRPGAPPPPEAAPGRMPEAALGRMPEAAPGRVVEGFAEAGAGLADNPEGDRGSEPDDAIDSAEALEAFLRALTGDRPAPPPPAAEPAAVLSFQRPERPAERERSEDPGDLARLAGAGPGLIWALQRAGLRRLADLAPLGPEELVARLGPIGRLVPAEAWLATARATPEA
jgi:predicted flap endonuclease-1-like 5' DNA nuclease